jgi:hypothetical protein
VRRLQSWITSREIKPGINIIDSPTTEHLSLWEEGLMDLP